MLHKKIKLLKHIKTCIQKKKKKTIILIYIYKFKDYNQLKMLLILSLFSN